MDGYAISACIDVRWRDVDALGHVNNAVYFTYMEVARSTYLDKLLGPHQAQDIPILLASARCDFRAQVTHGEQVEVGIRVGSVGNTSFDFEYEMRSCRDGRLVAQGGSAQVLYDQGAGQKLPVTEEWLDRIEACEGRRPPRRKST